MVSALRWDLSKYVFKTTPQHSILQHLNPQWVIQRRRGRGERLRDRKNKNKGAATKARSRKKGESRRNSTQGWKIRTEL